MFRACHAPSAGAAHAAVHKHRMQCLLDLVREVLQEGLRPQRLRSHNIAAAVATAVGGGEMSAKQGEEEEGSMVAGEGDGDGDGERK
jgi:hypothetical protein